MKLTILGCSGSLSAPGNPASGYLLSVDNAPSVIMDIGPGVLASAQSVQNPSDAHVVLSHLHPDHCLDFPSLLVWRRYHPEARATQRHLCIGPAETPERMGLLSGEGNGEIDDMSDTFAFTHWVPRQSEIVDRLRITPYPTLHPIESYALRIVEPHTGAVLAYSGDAAYSEDLIECAAAADLFLCEATWGASSDGMAPNIHMSGAEAGRLAQAAGVRELVLVHIPPWGDPAGAKAAAEAEFDGKVTIGQPGMEFLIP
ncbi:MBL fold metallo-hydrolase [Corynebacterium sp.]|uniref:MBL fold metallo-hydrolase n=1 Tax=Corynebacterium sp. TaxID=1720 RepID=UPI0026DC4EEA|nr:MBL fold metallo-hydrolase [Corynebacterium sp.]MDO5076217.1 MBL fold metallo-hydrolase [Corynebacterium sp.]